MMMIGGGFWTSEGFNFCTTCVSKRKIMSVFRHVSQTDKQKVNFKHTPLVCWADRDAHSYAIC